MGSVKLLVTNLKGGQSAQLCAIPSNLSYLGAGPEVGGGVLAAVLPGEMLACAVENLWGCGALG